MDVFEGHAKFQDVEGELSKYLTVVRQNMVHLGLADFFWVGLDNKRFTIEHKTGTEFMQTMGNRLDTQLRKHSQNADDVTLLIEGVIQPTPDGKKCFVWKPSQKNRNIMVKGFESYHSYQEVMGYIWSLEHNGFTVVQVPDWRTMCRAIAEFVYNTLKAEHRALRHYVKTKPIVVDPGASPKERMYIQTLMGLSEARIGEILAKRILATHGTPFKFFLSEMASNWDIGEATHVKAMKSIGRNV